MIRRGLGVQQGMVSCMQPLRAWDHCFSAHAQRLRACDDAFNKAVSHTKQVEWSGKYMLPAHYRAPDRTPLFSHMTEAVPDRNSAWGALQSR
jgi:hypothetical protein